MSGTAPASLAASMSAPLVAKLCRERAAQYGALRASSPTAVALDRAAELIETVIIGRGKSS